MYYETNAKRSKKANFGVFGVEDGNTAKVAPWEKAVIFVITCGHLRSKQVPDGRSRSPAKTPKGARRTRGRRRKARVPASVTRSEFPPPGQSRAVEPSGKNGQEGRLLHSEFCDRILNTKDGKGEGGTRFGLVFPGARVARSVRESLSPIAPR